MENNAHCFDAYKFFELHRHVVFGFAWMDYATIIRKTGEKINILPDACKNNVHFVFVVGVPAILGPQGILLFSSQFRCDFFFLS